MSKPTSNVDECCTVRLPRGVKDELKAATGQPFSTIVRFMCMHLLDQQRAKREAAGGNSAKQQLQASIAELPSPAQDAGA